VTTLCRDCGALTTATARGERCGDCGSPRQVCHANLDTLSIAHVDCDAFYATVEKRDRRDLADRPVIIGGGSRGVVLACCYVARLYGVRSAMPMFKALAACPDAVVIRPDMVKYRELDRPRRLEHAMDQIRGRLGEGSVLLGRGMPTAGSRDTLRHFGAGKRGDRMSSCGQQFGLASGSISSSLARIEYSP
jgi:hypothetical protein